MPRGKPGKLKAPARPALEVEAAAPPRMRLERERRSKAREDSRLLPDAQGKGRASHSSTLAKRKRVLVEVSDEEVEEGQEEEDDDDHQSGAFTEQSWRGYETSSDGEDSGGDTKGPIEEMQTEKKRKSTKTTAMKKPIELDANGEPHGVMREALTKDVVKYAKSLDPTKGWEGQAPDLRKALFQRLYSDWETYGHSKRVSERFLAPIITKSLITLRFKLNQMIDNEQPMPEDYNETYWKGLVALRATEEAEAKSAHMRAISKSKGTGSTQMKAVERQVVSHLALVLGRSPFDPEIDAEVARELKRISEEKRKGRCDYGLELDELRTRMTEVEGSMGRLELSQLRIEDMLKEVLLGKKGKDPQSLQDQMEPSSSIKFSGGLEPMSEGAAAWATVQNDSFMPMLKAATPTVDIPVPVTGDIVADAIPVEGDVVGDKDIAETDLVGDIPFEVVSVEASKSADVVAEDEEEVEEEEEDDAYKLPESSAIQPMLEGAASQGQSSNPQQKDAEAPADSSRRPRRPRKTTSTTSLKVVKTPLKTNVPKVAPKATNVTKPVHAASKVSSGKRSQAHKK